MLEYYIHTIFIIEVKCLRISQFDGRVPVSHGLQKLNTELISRIFKTMVYGKEKVIRYK